MVERRVVSSKQSPKGYLAVLVHKICRIRLCIQCTVQSAVYVINSDNPRNFIPRLQFFSVLELQFIVHRLSGIFTGVSFAHVERDELDIATELLM